MEGAEVQVFESLLRTIRKHHPIILAELADKKERIRMMEMLEPFGYRSYLLKNSKLHLLDVHSDELAISHNHYFIPASRLSRLISVISS